jgi:hypothetical protein
MGFSQGEVCFNRVCQMSIAVMTTVWADAPVSGNALLVLLALADWCNDDCECWPAYETLAKKARVSRSTVIRQVNDLERMGLLRINRNCGRANQNVYIVCVDGMASLKGVKMTPPPPEKVSNSTEKVSNGTVKGVMGDTQTVNEPLRTLSVAAPLDLDDLISDFWEAHPRPRDFDGSRLKLSALLAYPHTFELSLSGAIVAALLLISFNS